VQLALASAKQSWFPSYPIGALRLSARVELARLRSFLVRELSLNNPLAGTELSARGALELRARPGAGELTIVGREALQIEGSLSQALESFETLGYAAHARGKLMVPFRLESGGLLGYRLFTTLEAQHISFSSRDSAFGVEDLNGAIPVVEELALLPGVGRPVVSAGPRASPFADARFMDVHPFVTGADYLTAQSVWMHGIAPIGPLAANVRIERSDFLIDQLQAGFSSGQIVGQVRASYRDGDPIVRLRLNGTGLRAAKGGEVFDANAALTFVPNTLTLDGKLQLVRGSRAHLLAILDVVDPFHESVSANRVRLALRFGYPKFVRFHLHDGAIDTKVELGGLAQFVRIDEIKATPLGPIMQRYVAPALAFSAPPPSTALVAQTEPPEAR
jgi:translocation and assembly module TamB